MFGYVRARREDLKVRDDALYRGAYCGLCRAMGKCTGQCSRMTLSYDVVFLYLIRAALCEVTPTLKQSRCFVHPLKKRPMLLPDEALTYAARAGALLTYGKLEDDLADERGLRRLIKRMARPFAAHAKKRADLDELYEKVQAHLGCLAAIEREKQPSVDAPADVFGRLLADVFSFGLCGDAQTLAREIGFRTGRWIYAVDAADDIDRDAESGSYNPFLLLYGGRLDAAQKRAVERSMTYDLKALAAALDLLPENNLTRIAQNIIYLGMPDAAARALRQEGEHIDKESL